MQNTSNSHFVYFNTRDEFVRVDLRRVVYFEADRNYVHIIFQNGNKATILFSLGNLTKVLSVYIKEQNLKFVRIGKRYIVNLSFLYQINVLKQQLVLSDNITPKTYTLNISKIALKALKDLYSPKAIKEQKNDNSK